jgi:hypothetical protein
VQEALDICGQLVHLPGREHFVATVVESPALLLHGNIIVTEEEGIGDGESHGVSVVGEFVRGDSLPVSRAGVTPEYRLWQEPFLGSFRYNVDDPEIRQLLFRTINNIPRSDSGTDSSGARGDLAPGYYEIGIAKDDQSGAKRVYVYDMKPWGAK